MAHRPSQLNVRSWGDCHKPAILMLHGHPGNGETMAVFAEALQQHFWVIAPDLRGYGNSKVSSEFELEDHLPDLLALLDRLGIQQCYLLGWSFGGILSMELVIRYPGRFLGLILVASAGRPLGNHPPISLMDNLLTAITGTLNWLLPGRNWIIEGLGRRSLFRYLVRTHTPDTYRYLAEAAVPAYLQTSTLANRALAKALKDKYSCLDRLSTVEVPALVLAGECDRHITAAASRETAQTLPKCDYIEYPNTAHLFPWEIPRQVQQDIDNWLKHHIPSNTHTSS